MPVDEALITLLKEHVHKPKDELQKLSDESKSDGSKCQIVFTEETIKINGSNTSIYRIYLLPTDEDSNNNSIGWMSHENLNFCVICGTEFGILVWPHHCRSCGNLVCHNCSPVTETVNELKELGDVRVCTQCFWGQTPVHAITSGENELEETDRNPVKEAEEIEDELQKKNHKLRQSMRTVSFKKIKVRDPEPVFAVRVFRKLNFNENGPNSMDPRAYRTVFVNICKHTWTEDLNPNEDYAISDDVIKVENTEEDVHKNDGINNGLNKDPVAEIYHIILRPDALNGVEEDQLQEQYEQTAKLLLKELANKFEFRFNKPDGFKLLSDIKYVGELQELCFSVKFEQSHDHNTFVDIPQSSDISFLQEDNPMVNEEKLQSVGEVKGIHSFDLPQSVQEDEEEYFQEAGDEVIVDYSLIAHGAENGGKSTFDISFGDLNQSSFDQQRGETKIEGESGEAAVSTDAAEVTGEVNAPNDKESTSATTTTSENNDSAAKEDSSLTSSITKSVYSTTSSAFGMFSAFASVAAVAAVGVVSVAAATVGVASATDEQEETTEESKPLATEEDKSVTTPTNGSEAVVSASTSQHEESVAAIVSVEIAVEEGASASASIEEVQNTSETVEVAETTTAATNNKISEEENDKESITISSSEAKESQSTKIIAPVGATSETTSMVVEVQDTTEESAEATTVEVVPQQTVPEETSTIESVITITEEITTEIAVLPEEANQTEVVMTIDVTGKSATNSEATIETKVSVVADDDNTTVTVGDTVVVAIVEKEAEINEEVVKTDVVTIAKDSKAEEVETAAVTSTTDSTPEAVIATTATVATAIAAVEVSATSTITSEASVSEVSSGAAEETVGSTDAISTVDDVMATAPIAALPAAAVTAATVAESEESTTTTNATTNKETVETIVEVEKPEPDFATVTTDVTENKTDDVATASIESATSSTTGTSTDVTVDLSETASTTDIAATVRAATTMASAVAVAVVVVATASAESVKSTTTSDSAVVTVDASEVKTQTESFTATLTEKSTSTTTTTSTTSTVAVSEESFTTAITSTTTNKETATTTPEIEKFDSTTPSTERDSLVSVGSVGEVAAMMAAVEETMATTDSIVAPVTVSTTMEPIAWVTLRTKRDDRIKVFVNLFHVNSVPLVTSNYTPSPEYTQFTLEKKRFYMKINELEEKTKGNTGKASKDLSLTDDVYVNPSVHDICVQDSDLANKFFLKVLKAVARKYNMDLDAHYRIVNQQAEKVLPSASSSQNEKEEEE